MSGGPRKSGGNWRAVLGIILSIAFLVYALRGVSPSAVLTELRGVHPLLLLAAAAAATFLFWLRAWRWKSFIVPVYPQTKFRPRFAATIIGFMANNVLPARVGEFLRAYVLSRLEPVPVVSSLGSLVMERLFDGLTLVAFTFVALALPSFPSDNAAGQQLEHVATILAIVFAGIGAFFVALVAWPRQAVALVERVVNRVVPGAYRRIIVDALESLLASFGAIRRPALLARIVGWSITTWLVGAFSFWLGMLAFDIRVPFLAAVFLQSVVAFSVAIPSSPGFFGIFEAAVRVGLVEIWGVAPNTAISYAIGFHLAGYIPVTVMGLYYVWRTGISWKEVEKGEEAVEDTVERELPGAQAALEDPAGHAASSGERRE